ncbi:hypothetical protein [Cedecea colo]|uniref:Uncharacterized protein n=1 Tax=Cedecea colo TaxID=2552946 RepID=A0ABX0VPY3_9ENTR|nr:hypothetical protein [Cedecea colo]NIY48355.1 hypothetical protein [Cedecea colo]
MHGRACRPWRDLPSSGWVPRGVNGRPVAEAICNIQVHGGRSPAIDHNAGDYTHSRAHLSSSQKPSMRSYASNLHYGERRRLWQWVQAAVLGHS